jgi:hypothetical protein
MIDKCVLDVHETASELATCDLDHPVICRCRKHRQLVHQERHLHCAIIWMF